jgi:excisionase family DNA binding protein
MESAVDHEVTPLPRFASIRDWCRISGMGRTTVYQRIASGELRAVKLGTRVLIDVESGLAWLSSLPAADIRWGRRRAA